MKQCSLLIFVIILIASCAKDEEIKTVETNYIEYNGVTYDLKTCIVEDQYYIPANSHSLKINLLSVDMTQTEVDSIYNLPDNFYYKLASSAAISLINTQTYFDGNLKSGNYEIGSYFNHPSFSTDFNNETNEYDTYIELESGTAIINVSDGKIEIDVKSTAENNTTIEAHYEGPYFDKVYNHYGN
ncbi:hypothetical protein [Sunxiuqinia indica]|uniref:hypothetical protein n=1 Tax=Sunxiuqinia indica TaxID=2692584 RepID=UPI001359FC2F|nr:hypothetical protein [Sunxiuqinia indica]